MLSNFKIGTILAVGILTTSVLLFPESGRISETPLGKSMHKIEMFVDEQRQLNDNPIELWRLFQSRLMEELASVQVDQLSDEELNYMFNKIKNLALPIVKSVMKHGAKNLGEFSDYERYLMSCLVDSSIKMVKKGSIAYRFINHLKKKLDRSVRTPFEYLKGEISDIKLVNQLKVFSWNTCLMPGNLSKVHSGLDPWKTRIESILGVIGEQNADIICLQEVYSEEAAIALYHRLKSQYAHFYINMGPSVMGTSASDVALSSGLFVASKVDLEDVHFECFKGEDRKKLINQGFFWAQIAGSEIGFATSHLSPFDDFMDQKVRADELNTVIKFMKQQDVGVKILVGDLNIPYGSKEPAEDLISMYFFDPYNKNRSAINKHSRTFSDHFVSKSHQTQSSILDYFLVMQEPGFEKYAYVIERVEGFDELTLKSKGSDHHGLFSQIVFPCSKL